MPNCDDMYVQFNLSAEDFWPHDLGQLILVSFPSCLHLNCTEDWKKVSVYQSLWSPLSTFFLNVYINLWGLEFSFTPVSLLVHSNVSRLYQVHLILNMQHIRDSGWSWNTHQEENDYHIDASFNRSDREWVLAEDRLQSESHTSWAESEITARSWALYWVERSAPC